jgi:hypothetical protein
MVASGQERPGWEFIRADHAGMTKTPSCQKRPERGWPRASSPGNFSKRGRRQRAYAAWATARRPSSNERTSPSKIPARNSLTTPHGPVEYLVFACGKRLPSLRSAPEAASKRRRIGEPASEVAAAGWSFWTVPRRDLCRVSRDGGRLRFPTVFDLFGQAACAALPGGVIGNTEDFGSSIPGSSPGRVEIKS